MWSEWRGRHKMNYGIIIILLQPTSYDLRKSDKIICGTIRSSKTSHPRLLQGQLNWMLWRSNWLFRAITSGYSVLDTEYGVDARMVCDSGRWSVNPMCAYGVTGIEPTLQPACSWLPTRGAVHDGGHGPGSYSAVRSTASSKITLHRVVLFLLSW